jgi:hypothetical protein
MFAHTIKAAQVLAFVFISAAASAQPYNQAANDRSNEQSVSEEPITVDHIELGILQQETGSMKFRVAVLNPFSRAATITICKGRDVLYTENGIKGQYKIVFNFDEVEDGNYQIVVTSGKETVSKDINIHTQTTTIREARVN